MAESKPKFDEIGELMSSELPGLGALASAIEEAGIYGWDIYGRFMHFAPESEQSKQVLNAIAEDFSWSTDHIYPQQQRPLDLAEGFSVFTKYGWPRDKLPDFTRFGSTEVNVPIPPVRASTEKRKENASAAIIGALLAYISGEVNNHRHIRYTGIEEHLIDELVGAYRDFPGISRSNLINKFALGKAILASSGVKKRNRTRPKKSSTQ